MPTPLTAAARWFRDRALLPAAIVAFAAFRATTGDWTEAMWMSREGRDVLAGGGFVHPDRWSWAPRVDSFIPTSPGWEIIAGLAVLAGGTLGLWLLAFLATAGGMAALSWTAARLQASPTATIVALLAGGSLASAIITSRASFPALALLLAALTLFWTRREWIATAARSAVTLACAIGTFATAYLGIWLHGSWTLFALALCGGQVFLLCNPNFGDVRRRVMIAFLDSCAALVAVSVGPLGITAWSNTLRVGMECRGLITEWMSAWALGWDWRAIWLGTLLTLVLVTRRLQHHGRLRIPTLETLLLAMAFAEVLAGLVAVRFLVLGIITAIPVVARSLSDGPRWERWPQLRERLGERTREPYWRTIITALTALSLPLVTVHAILTPHRPDAAITALPRDCQLFSRDGLAKEVEFWRPDVRVWIDGRQDYWGRDRILLMSRYLATTQGEELVPSGTTCVLLRSGEDAALARRLDGSAAWQRGATGEQLILWVTRAPA